MEASTKYFQQSYVIKASQNSQKVGPYVSNIKKKSTFFIIEFCIMSTGYGQFKISMVGWNTIGHSTSTLQKQDLNI